MVERNYDRDTVHGHVLDLLVEVLAALIEGLHVLLRKEVLVKRLARYYANGSTVHLESPDRGDHDRGARLQAAEPRLDVEELLGADVSAESGFR